MAGGRKLKARSRKNSRQLEVFQLSDNSLRFEAYKQASFLEALKIISAKSKKSYVSFSYIFFGLGSRFHLQKPEIQQILKIWSDEGKIQIVPFRGVRIKEVE